MTSICSNISLNNSNRPCNQDIGSCNQEHNTRNKPRIVFEDTDDEKEEKCLCVIPGCKNIQLKIGSKSFCKKHNKKFKFDKPSECPICIESLNNEKYPLINCGHWIHHNCVIESGKQECPICRASVKLTREQKKEICKKSKQIKIEQEREELEQLRNEYEYENEIQLYAIFRNIFEDGCIDEGLQTLLEQDIYSHMENIERDLKRLSRDRTNISKRNTSKMLLILLNNNEELLSTFFKDQNEEIITTMIENIIRTEWQAYNFVKRNIFNLNY